MNECRVGSSESERRQKEAGRQGRGRNQILLSHCIFI